LKLKNKNEILAFFPNFDAESVFEMERAGVQNEFNPQGTAKNIDKGSFF
jgi:hypothetical protein